MRVEIAVFAALALFATHSAAYFLGRAHEETAHVVEAANNTAGANEANAEGQRGVTQADAALAAENHRLNSELNNARAVLAQFRHVVPADGRVGPAALIDPAYGRVLLDCIERVRAGAAAEAEALNGDCAPDRIERQPTLQPVPGAAGPAAGP